MSMSIGKEYDVVVAGAGPTGICAAISAARTGARTLLVEQLPFLGGEAATGLNVHGFHNASEEHVIRGIPWEIILRLKELGGAGLCRSRDPKNPDRPTGSVRDIAIDRELFIHVALQMLEEAGVDMLFYTSVHDVVMDGEDIRGVVAHNKSGSRLLLARVIIDTTGDGDVAFLAGAPFEKGRKADGVMQPLSMMTTFGGVDLERAVDHFNHRRAEAIDPLPGHSKYMHFNLPLHEWTEDIKREFPEIAPFSSFQGNALYKGIINGTTATHIAKVDATNTEQLSRAEVLSRSVAIRLAEFLRRRVPGFEECFVLRNSPHIGVRETRRIMGEYCLTYDDVVDAQKSEDVVVLGGFFVDIHNYEGLSGGEVPPKGVLIKDQGSFDIPYGCFVPLKVENLLVAGRCLSASHEAMAAARVMGTCMGMGHAVGTAAALAIQEGATPRQLDVSKLQQVLLRQGAYLGEE